MSRTEYKRYNELKALLKFAYTIADRYTRQRAVANIQARMAEMMYES